MDNRTLAAARSAQDGSNLTGGGINRHLLQRRDTARAAEALESAIFMNPYDIALHDRLATLYTRVGERRSEVTFPERTSS